MREGTEPRGSPILPGEAAGRTGGNPIRVLVIEDDPADTRLIRKMLGEAGVASFELEHADRLAAGLERLGNGGIDAVLLDVGLPDSQGWQTIQACAHLCHLPFVVLTGLDDELLALRAAREGIEEYFVKGQIEGHTLARGIQYAIERKQKEIRLRESEDRLRTIITSAPVVLFALDREGRFTLSEGTGLAALGLRPGEAEGRSVFDMYRDSPEVIANMWRALSGESFTAAVEVNGLAYETHHAPIRDQSGELAGVIGVATDVTERVRAKKALTDTVAELQQKTEELEAFSYSVSHDLKEPLRTLEAFSQFLLEDYAGHLDEQGRDYLTRIARASGRLKQMIEDLLLLSRIGRRSEAIERVDVGQVVANIVAAMQMTVEERGASIEVAAGLPHIEGALAHTQQIFGNLVTNALKFNHREHPVVKVGVRHLDGRTATFFVQDNGIGIDPQYHEQIFGVFKRLHRREAYDGTGAGLTIAKRAVEAMGGQVWLQSEPDRGSTFFVRLPLWQGAPRVPDSKTA